MKEWNASTNVWRWCLLGLFWLGASQGALSQCPVSETITVQTNGKHAFAQNQGEIDVLFKDIIDQEQNSYRVRLYDASIERYVYDDNNPPFLNQVPAPVVSRKQIVFTNLPTGKYELELHGGECHYQRYQVNTQRD